MSGRTPECSGFTAAYSGKMVLELSSESVVQFFLFASLRTRKRIQNFLVTIFRERKVGGGERSWKFLLEEKGLIWNEEYSLTNEKRDQDRNTEKSFAFRTEKEEKPRKGTQRYPKTSTELLDLGWGIGRFIVLWWAGTVMTSRRCFGWLFTNI